MPPPPDMEPEYPGLEFMPPQGTVEDALEGEALVKWKKVGDRYTIVEFEGEPLKPGEPKMSPMKEMEDELVTMDNEGA